MSSFELNKIMGAVFSIALLLLIIKNITDILYYEEQSNEVIKVAEVKSNLIIKENEDNPETSIEIRLANADINEGLKMIKKCEVCHTFTKDGKNKLGPNLYNISARKIASVEGF